ncbi:PREDICTED: protein DOG1-like 4 [Ipomoea nil]|uniref:protein DOG1-like 4 n=1 Tax=Ipomoea nil TaxID=35883 RepID=UPI000901F769|nr:PREDICTED: protein DOG1-like 4 [Ipomoea nil]
MSSSSIVGEDFTAFYHGWLMNQDAIFEQLESFLAAAAAADDDREQCGGLVGRVLAHYQEYYAEKTKAAEEDVFVFFASPWMSRLEQSFLWLSGFKPSMLFWVVESSMEGALSEEQRCKVGMLRAETARVENAISKAMASAQETVAAPPILGLLKRAEELVDGEVSELDAVMGDLKQSMGRLMGNADALRGSTASKILEILNPKQAVKFLTAVMRFQREARRWGLYNDSQREATSTLTNNLF